ncbi:MAG: tRNA (adenosine(37)-N6)-threonylcarbamoyltransferase complex dimerization subunit type 1 TsaB [Phycisphaerae bacterium]
MTRPTTGSGFALAFETSSAWGSIALGQGQAVLATRAFSAPRRHAVEFLPTIQALCQDCSVQPSAIEHVYVSAGPGSFTGLRIGITAARTVAFASGARTVGVPSLEVIAQNAADAPDPPNRVVVILDAKRKRVYAAAFVRRGGEYVPTTEPAEVVPAEFLAQQDASSAVLGEGVAYHRAAVEGPSLSVLPETLNRPRAETVYRLGAARARLGRFDDPIHLVPIYIRPPEAEEKWRQLHADSNGHSP